MIGPARKIAAACALALAVPAAPAVAQQDLEDILGGFEDEDPDFAVERDDFADDDAPERFWDLSGSLELSGSVNYLKHRSATGTDYRGLQRLRQRGNLQLDLTLPHAWQARVEGWGFADAAYRINGRQRYSDAVLDTYELDAEVGEAWIAGKLAPQLDLKLGRQVVIWGRSESLRVLDILNPLDNREPGRVDLEDLRRPVGMLRLDAFAGRWSATGVVVPEIRFDEVPVVGSDFFPSPFSIPESEPENFEDPEVAGSLTGTFRGWDLTFQGAWYWNDQARLRRNAFPLELVHDRLWMVGAGGNYTVGSWLLKGEVAFVDGLGFFGSAEEKSRGDVLVGVEYYGWRDTSFVVEVVERHLFDYERALLRAPDSVRRNSQEVSLRLTRNFWNDTLHFTALGILFGLDGHDGSIARADVEYDVRDAVSVGVGILFYQEGRLPPLSTWGENDRVFFHLKWSF